ncbi:PKD-like family lipoprotein [Pseudoflavitalea rhizosphaerae]|uniref:PKD-like family lipoprotein n=1 Tax=Pseudoflavitalea rhizosphaerae TaxID=1884793 RepID=UPI000F8CA35D|nr:PKD-like family lipoprotein [Pseudoflavitalea rhizosphaerae]
MKTIHITRLLLLAGMICQFSCVKDNSNFDYKKGNPVKITFDGNMQAVVDEPLSLTPIREYEKPGISSGDYDHEWYQDGVLISKDSNLVYNATKPGYFLLHYYMIEKASGIRFDFGAGLTVISPYETGWGILYEKDGVSEIAHVRKTATGYKDQLALYSDKNKGESLGSQPLRIKDYYVNGGRGLAVIQQGGQGTVEMDGRSFEKKLVLNESFTGGTPQGLKPVNAGYYETSDLLLNEDGKLYARLFQANPIAFTVPWLNIPLEISKGMKIKHLWDVWTTYTAFTVMYDELNNRLLYASLKLAQTMQSGGALKIDTFPPPPPFMPALPGYIDPSKPLTGYDYIWGGAFKDDAGFSATCMFLVRDQATDELYLQPFNFFSILGIQTIHTPAMRQTFTGKQYITPASHYVAVKKRNFLFFSGNSDNRGLYYYDVSIGGPTKMYHTLPAAITVLRQSDDGQELAVGMADGTVIFYDISNQAMLSGGPVELHRLSGLGRVADITVRGGLPL